MPPDFNKLIVTTIAQRAGYRCSNPNCGRSTVGPNDEPAKATVIGNAAHIYGARASSARFQNDMTDLARAEITNAIWLCSNCHVIIDRDPGKFSATLLFGWKEDHEKAVAEELGNSSQRLRYQLGEGKLVHFNAYPQIVRRIVVDEPPGWEWRLAAELLYYLNEPHFKRYEDLRSGLYREQIEYVDEGDCIEWINRRLAELGETVQPLSKLLEKLTESFGPAGLPGNAAEIERYCRLIAKNVGQVVDLEERIAFVGVPDRYSRLIGMLNGSVGDQAEKFRAIPAQLNEIVSRALSEEIDTDGTPRVIPITITFELPDGFERRFAKELKRIEKSIVREARQMNGNAGISWFWIGILIFVIAVFVF